MPYDRQGGTFAEYRRLIFRMLEERKEDHDEFKRDTNKELKEVKEELAKAKSIIIAMKESYSQTKFKLNLLHTFIAALPGLIALALAWFKK
jgi:hypothetical protein